MQPDVTYKYICIDQRLKEITKLITEDAFADQQNGNTTGVGSYVAAHTKTHVTYSSTRKVDTEGQMNIESVNLFPKHKFATTVIAILNKTSERERLSLEELKFLKCGSSF